MVVPPLDFRLDDMFQVNNLHAAAFCVIISPCNPNQIGALIRALVGDSL